MEQSLGFLKNDQSKISPESSIFVSNTDVPRPPKNYRHLTVILVILTAILIVVGGYLVINSASKPQNQPASFTPKISPVSYRGENFFLTAVPKPLKNLVLEDLPDSNDIEEARLYKGHLWLSGDGSLIEYDPGSKKIVRYSNPRKVDCSGNIVIVNDFLFAACRQGAVNNVYNPDLEWFPYAVYKINLLNYSLEHVFNKTDGLLNGDNYFLTPDGDAIWVDTFEGIGKINAKTNEVKFYTTEMGLKDNHVIIISIDDKYVWVVGKGELAYFDKTMQQWVSFPPEVIADNKTDGSNTISGFKTTPEGAEIGLFAYDGRKCLLRKYEYSSQRWTTTADIQTGSPQVYVCDERLKTYFPVAFPISGQSPKKTVIDESGLTQITLATSSGEVNRYEINGRVNIYLSPMLNGKRYVLTSATVDVIDESLNLPEIHIKLGGSSLHSRPYVSGSYVLLIDPETLVGVVIDAGCTPQPSCLEQTMWLLDFKAKLVLKVYDIKIPSDYWYILDKFTLTKQQNSLMVNDQNGKPLFHINLTTYNLDTLK
ncbi:MAG: hypothetical protein Q8P89_03515 [bacterium]|nr:hypothetical protein [bacterium]